MAGTLKHKFVSAKVDSTDTTLVRPVNWNDEHAFAGGADGAYLSRDSAQTDGVTWKTVLVPAADNASDLGSASLRWRDLFLSDQLIVSGVGPHAIGGATTANVQLRLIGNFFPSGGGNAVGFQINPTLNTEVNLDAYLQQLAGTFAKAGSGTHALFAGLKIEAPVIIAGAAALTNAASLYIAAAPTSATNNYALWVDAGLVRIDDRVFINELTNAFMTIGLTIHQGANDDEAIALKNSSVVHTMTSVAEEDTYGRFRKISPTDGGLLADGFSDSGVLGVMVRGFGNGDDTTKATTSLAPLILGGGKASAGSVVDPGTNGNLVAIRSVGGNTRFIFDIEGDSHQDVGTAWTNFDDHDDAMVLNSLALEVSRPDDPWKERIRANFADSLDELLPRQVIQDMKLVTFNDDGHHFVNMSRLAMLLTGAVRQLARKNVILERRLEATEQKLLSS